MYSLEDQINDHKLINKSNNTTDQNFLISCSKLDSKLDHEDGCGQCEHQKIMAEVAREMLENNISGDIVQLWCIESDKRWKESKYVKFWNECVEKGLDPNKAFADRNWEL